MSQLLAGRSVELRSEEGWPAATVAALMAASREEKTESIERDSGRGASKEDAGGMNLMTEELGAEDAMKEEEGSEDVDVGARRGIGE